MPKNKIIIICIFLGIAVCTSGLYFGINTILRQILIKPGEPLVAYLDTTGPYLILSTTFASKEYKDAINEAGKLHPEAVKETFNPEDISSAQKFIKKYQPCYILVFIKPDELDVNFAWNWLKMSSEIDEDPFVDVRTGFITGESPEAASNFMKRITRAAKGEITLPGMVIDDLGANTMMETGGFQKNKGSFFLPVFEEKFGIGTISHGTQGFTQEKLNSMDGSGIIHFGGHGYPDRIVDSLNGPYVRQLILSPSVVFNGACYTGVTGRWYELFTPDGNIKENMVEPDKSFCMGILANNTVAYLAALHPDHGIPVYQEMEYLAWSGSSLGEVMRYTHNGVIIASGGKMPDFETLAGGMPSPKWTPADVMLKGTASRVLFGDPSLIITEGFTEAPFDIKAEKVDDKTLQISAVLQNTNLKSTFTDTYYSDLSSDKTLFNDRALIMFELPEGWEQVSKVEIIKAVAGKEELQYRLIGFAVEKEKSQYRLYVQVDFPTTGYMQSAFRQAGSSVKFKVIK